MDSFRCIKIQKKLKFLQTFYFVHKKRHIYVKTAENTIQKEKRTTLSINIESTGAPDKKYKTDIWQAYLWQSPFFRYTYIWE